VKNQLSCEVVLFWIDASKFGREVEVLFSVSKELLSKRWRNRWFLF